MTEFFGVLCDVRHVVRGHVEKDVYQQLYGQIVYGRQPVDGRHSDILLRLRRRLDRQAQVVVLRGLSV